jgi:hypothetical protein
MLDHMPSADAVPVETLELDPFETGLLAVLRHFLTAFAHPESQAWQTAFALACERWGTARGPQIAMGVLPVLQSLRGARRGAFDFANPLCVTCRDYVTGTEAAFMQMLQAMRRDRTDLARGAVLILTEGTMDPGLIQAALAFAARHPAETREMPYGDVEPDAWHTPKHRHLRLVH